MGLIINTNKNPQFFEILVPVLLCLYQCCEREWAEYTESTANHAHQGKAEG
jgi:hypothetical protein